MDTLVRTCEVLDLETRTIRFVGDLQSPSSFLQMVTLGQGDFLIAFAHPGAVAKADMVLWNPTNSTWNRDFPDTVSGSAWPARFGASVVSRDMICPNLPLDVEILHNY